MVILQISKEELDQKFAEIRGEIKNSRPAENEKILTRREAAKLLHVSLPTLAAWEKTGQIKPRRIGSRVYFTQSELIGKA
jgi:DNA-binding transcriptional regulator YiaG